MIGMVVCTWIETSKQLYGHDVTEDALKGVNWTLQKKFSPMEVVDDQTVKKFIESLARSTNYSIEKIWSDIGKDNIKIFTKKYPLFFLHKNLYGFLKSLNTIHKTIVDRMPTSKPPYIDISPISKREIIFTYKSSRGMFDYMFSMITGAAEYYNEKVVLTVLEKTDDSVKVKIAFEKDIVFKKKYYLNKILSFGFIKRIELKIAIVTMISLYISHLFFSVIALNIGFFEEIIGVLIASIFSAILLSPVKLIKLSLKNISEKNYLEDIEIETNDFFQDISDMTRKISRISNDTIITFEGITDEVKDFNIQFEERLKNSYSTFKEITNAVAEVTNGAVQQANDSETAVTILNENSTTIDNILDSQEESQKNLIKVVDEISNNNKSMQLTADNLQLVTDKFSEINIMSNNLQNDIKEVINIVSTVTSIAEETSLLSLNASIEAARAGEAGKGFSVVAEEVRKLSDSSKNAANEISKSLDAFIQKINVLNQKIDMQYETLNTENNNIITVAQSSSQSAINVDKVSKEITLVKEKLTKQIKDSSKVFESMESLVAIGEENASMSEQVQATIDSFASEITEIITIMGEIDVITGKFSQSLSDHIM